MYKVGRLASTPIRPRQRVEQFQLIDRLGVEVDQAAVHHQHGQDPRAADGDVEAVFRIEEVGVPGQVLGTRAGHADQDDLGFLALELVDGTNAGIVREERAEQINLSIIGRDHQNVVKADHSFAAVAADEAGAEQIAYQIADRVRFLLTGLAAAFV